MLILIQFSRISVLLDKLIFEFVLTTLQIFSIIVDLRVNESEKIEDQDDYIESCKIVLPSFSVAISS